MNGNLPTVNFDTSIVVKQGSILFNDSEIILQRATEIRDYILNIEVTEETIQSAKKLVASLNKEVKALNDNRIRAKKELLKPYGEVEIKVKEISNVANEASSHLRDQVRVFEELEREEKERTLKEIFEKRKVHYDYNELFDFDDYLEQKYLNKSFTLKNAESEMVDWFERRKNDLIAITTFEPQESIDYINAYFNKCGLDLSRTITLIQNDRDNRQKVESVVLSQEKETKVNVAPTKIQEYVTYRIPAEKSRIVEEIFKNANIEYTII